MVPPGRAAVIGELVRVQGFALAGAGVLPAESPDAARAAWRELSDDVVLVILTPAAAEALAAERGAPAPGRLTVVMPP
jgi:vacuolar-type H+-ATPase subunit F/Vma7